jgi:aminomethyltransferase
LFQRIKSMTTVRDLQILPEARDKDVRNPLNQKSMVWKVIPNASLTNDRDQPFSRPQDVTGILDDLARAVGPPTAMCVLGDNVIGVTDWEQIPLEDQYCAVTERAGAFVASNMHYLRLSGPDAAAVLNMLTPRNVHGLAPGRAMFTLFTTAVGTVDEEAIVLRTGDEDYLVSCGGGKPLSWLPEALKTYSQATVEHSGIVSFNIKGPKRVEAMQALVHADDSGKLLSLQPFQACCSRTTDGDPVWILRTVVGVEMWGHAPVIRRTWHRILEYSDFITPCGWDLLNVYRMECTSMVFALYPLDVHLGTTIWEVGYGWMVEKGKEEFFVGQAALEKSKGKKRLYLGGLMAHDGALDAPPVGTEIYNPKGEFAGYVTSAAFSIKHGRALAFAHLKTEYSPGDILTLNGDQEWAVRSLPFTGKS